MITEDTLWESNINPDNIHAHPIKKLNNEHLANIIQFFKNNGQDTHGHTDLERVGIITLMIVEAMRRGLTRAFLDKAPYPYDPTAPYIEYDGPRLCYDDGPKIFSINYDMLS